MLPHRNCHTCYSFESFLPYVFQTVSTFLQALPPPMPATAGALEPQMEETVRGDSLVAPEPCEL